MLQTFQYLLSNDCDLIVLILFMFLVIYHSCVPNLYQIICMYIQTQTNSDKKKPQLNH